VQSIISTAGSAEPACATRPSPIVTSQTLPPGMETFFKTSWCRGGIQIRFSRDHIDVMFHFAPCDTCHKTSVNCLGFFVPTILGMPCPCETGTDRGLMQDTPVCTFLSRHSGSSIWGGEDTPKKNGLSFRMKPPTRRYLLYRYLKYYYKGPDVPGLM